MFNEKVWKEGESETQKYMKRKGYKIIYTNFSCLGVELDIVSVLPVRVQKREQKRELKKHLKEEKNRINYQNLKKNYKNSIKNLQNLLIITEVKSRSSNKFGKGYEAINEQKIRHIQRGAEYLLRKPDFKDMQVRFDVSSVDEGKITYIENAF